MKKMLKEFKDFAMRGNVIDMAIGIVIGGAFSKVITAVIDIFLTPILESLPKMENGGTGFAGSIITFVAVLVEFILTALVLFLIVKAINKAKNAKKKPEEAPAAPTTKECPFCYSTINIKATRCPNCTAELAYKPEKK
ncbi:MAG: large conductance mechanosensitive channel protein MscL [Clostridia bacterium]|nr:large conductance mechanosensitive channel protein MscL [Clostridia bacterium]